MSSVYEAQIFPLSEPDYTSKRIRDFDPFEDRLAGFSAERAEFDELLADASIMEIQSMLDAGALTSVDLVTYYVDRIRRHDVDKLNAVMELNSNALDDAAAADASRAAGIKRGPMHGIPVLLKDNIATGDGMRTTAGAYALRNWQPDRDAFLVQQLRAAGAIILGKANLSEWANYMDPAMPNGFSTLGGQTRHPYGAFDPLGSSSGSAVGVAANFATVAVGSETQGSIIAPSKVNSVVGLKPSRGLVSGDYIIPLVDWMDTAGPIGRNVTDVAILLTTMTNVDGSIEASEALTEMQTQDFARYASAEAAQGLIVAIPVFDDAFLTGEVALLEGLGIEVDDAQRTAMSEELASRNKQMQTLGAMIRDAGLDTIEVSAVDLSEEAPVSAILEYGFQDSFNRFAAQAGGAFPVGELADVVTINDADGANRAPYGQGYVAGSAQTTVKGDEYVTMKDRAITGTAAALSTMLDASEADVMLISDFSRDLTQQYAAAGFPAITVPLGFADDGKPTGMLLTGRYLSEPKLIAAAYAIEQALQTRRTPDLAVVEESFKGLNLAEPGIE